MTELDIISRHLRVQHERACRLNGAAAVVIGFLAEAVSNAAEEIRQLQPRPDACDTPASEYLEVEAMHLRGEALKAKWAAQAGTPEGSLNLPSMADIGKPVGADLGARFSDLLPLMANTFLAWPLPDDVVADICAVTGGPNKRSGTNLLTYTQALEMLKAVVGPFVPALRDTAFKGFGSNDIVDLVQSHLAALDDEKRLAFFDRLEGDYCRHCGCNTGGQRCHCQNDE